MKPLTWLLHAHVWLRSIFSTSALFYIRFAFCSRAHMELEPQLTQEDSEMLEAFKHLGPLLMSRYERPDDAREQKKMKKEQGQPENKGGDALKLLQAMGALLIRVDAEQQVLKRQDCWICFMQTEPQALLPSLIQKATEWHQQRKTGNMTPDEQLLPLRCHLTQHLADFLMHRLLKLSQCKENDPLRTTAIAHGALTQEGSFPYQRWHQATQQLKTTSQEPITMARMLKYGEQLQAIMKDQSAIAKFHSLKPQAAETVIPWLMQVSMRHDELQTLLTILHGNTVWSLVGMSVKPHSQSHSRPAQHLMELLGKGQGKSRSKGKAKGAKGGK